MTDHFREPKRRIARAMEHFDDLKAGINSFLQAEPFAAVIEPDRGGFGIAHKIKATAEVPDRLHNLTTEIAEGLRSALDGAGFAAAIATGNTRLRGTYFPIADTPEKLETDVIGRGRCKDLPPDILTFFRALKPYKAGNFSVWAVNQIANGTKHRILAPTGMGVGGSGLANYQHDGMTIEMSFPPMWDAEHNEMVLCVVAPGPEPTYNFELAMQVSLRPVDVFGRRCAAQTCADMINEVNRIVLSTEAKTRELVAAKC